MTAQAADIVITGTIFTGTSATDTAEAAAVRDGAFVYVGDAEGAKALVGPATRVVDAGEGLVLPGIVDGHMHFSLGAFAAFCQADLACGRTVAEYLDILAAFMEAHPDRPYYQGFGWDNAVFEAEGLVPARALLDELAPGVPIAIKSYDAHSALVSTAWLEAAGVDEAYEPVGAGELVRDGSGAPTGLLREWVVNDVIDRVATLSPADMEPAILALQERLLALGITQFYEPVIDSAPVMREAYRALDAAGKLKLKVVAGFHCMPDLHGAEQLEAYAAERDAYAGTHFRMNNAKFFIDGVVESETGWLLEDYAHRPGYASGPLCTAEQLETQMRAAVERGFQIHVHAIGDAALDMALTALERVRPFCANPDWRPTITHLQLARPADIERMAALGAVACTDPCWHLKDPEYYTYLALPYLGEERAAHECPLESFWRAGCTVTTGTDFPVSDPNPLLGIETGVTRSVPGDATGETALWPEEAATVPQMLLACTANGAYQNFWENQTGTIEVGKRADAAVFDRNLLTIDPHQIHTARCLLTLADGAIAYEA